MRGRRGRALERAVRGVRRRVVARRRRIRQIGRRHADGLVPRERRRRQRTRLLHGRLEVGETRLAAPERAGKPDHDLLELVPRLARAAVAVARLLGDHPPHPRVQSRVQPRGERRQLIVDVLHHHRDRRPVGAERHRARQQLVGDDAGLIDVGPRPDLGRHRLLGRHVGRRADRRARRREHLLRRDLLQRLGDPEVRDLHAAVHGHEQVLGLDVAVDDPHRLRVRERGEQPFEHARRLRQRQLADERAQRPADEVLHRDVRDAVLLEEVVDRDDVRVVQRAGDLRLADEAPGHRRIAGADLRQLLDRDVARQVRLAREVHDRHAASPHHPDDPVRTDLLRDSRHQRQPCHIVSMRRPRARGLQALARPADEAHVRQRRHPEG